MKLIRRLSDNNQKGWIWFLEWLEQFDLTKLHSISVSDNAKHTGTIGGKCYYPVHTKNKKYKFICRVGNSKEIYTHVRLSPIYRNTDGTWDSPPDGAWVHCYNYRNGTEWNSIKKRLDFNNLDEAIVWICGHEAFHFLRHSKQIPGRNNEIQADKFATDLLKQFIGETSCD